MRHPFFLIIALGFAIYHFHCGNTAAVIWALIAFFTELFWIIRLNHMIQASEQFKKDIEKSTGPIFQADH